LGYGNYDVTYPVTVRLTVTGGNLAVTLASFEAEAQPDGIRVRWETTSEVGNLGFNLYRAETPAGPRTQVNPVLIPSQAPGGTQGASYEYLDASVQPGQVYYYWLEDIHQSGATTLHGPVSATASAPTAVTLSGLSASQPAMPAPAAGPLAVWLAAVAAAAAGSVVVWRRRR
jgi:hypothetical protein